MRQFEILDIFGDAGIRAFGNNLQELFVNAATGMYSLITDLENIQDMKKLDISAQGSSLEGLLVSFLNELIFHFDTYGFVGKSITIKSWQAGGLASLQAGEPESGQAYSLEAKLSGDEFD
ncbi:MAG: archease, partial [Nitrospirota bacterium]|nr:archease [Nitrospirota bacterium]